jgi:glycosyltransferase involved in cell wall biosynthesis
MSINLYCPINLTGYGIASLNIVKQLSAIDKVSLFPIGNPGVQSQEDYDFISFLLSDQLSFDPLAPCLKIWHQFDLSSRIGKGKYFAYPFFELDTFDKREIINLSVPDGIFVSCEWAKKIIESNGIKTPTYVAPLGVDLSIFDSSINTTKNNDKYIFGNIGKWEVRKGHDILYDLFNKAFPNNENVELRILASEKTNNYSSDQELKQWKELYSKDSRIKIFTGVNSHKDIAKFISDTNCGIFPSRAEGWNLELLEFMAMNKPVISTNYSAHTEFCNSDNCYLVNINGTEKAYDGKAFNGQGNWAKIGPDQIDQLIEHMKYCYNHRISSNPEGIKTANKFSWNNTANIIRGCIYS